MSAERRTEPIGWGGYSLIAGLATLVLLTVKPFSMGGRNGSLSYCLGGMPWLGQVAGIVLIACFATTIVLVGMSFFDGTWRLGLLSVASMIVSSPVIVFLYVFVAYGDLGDFEYCLFSPP